MAKEKEIRNKEFTKQNKEKKKGGLIIWLIIFILVLLLLLGSFLALLRFNVLGLGTMLAPTLRPYPLSEWYLPAPEETGEVVLDPETGEPIVPPVEESPEEVKEILKLTEAELKKTQDEKELLLKELHALKSENEKLQIFKEKQLQFEEEKRKFDSYILEKSDETGFAAWYEIMNPDNAARLYQQSKANLALQKELEELTKVYQDMKPKPAAKILEQMSGTRLEMVAMLIKNMDANQAGKVLAEMDPKAAARITTYLYPEE